MRDLSVVFQFEFLQQVKKKVFLTTTILLMLLVAAAAAAPAVIARLGIGSDESSSGQNGYVNETVPGGYYLADEALAEQLNLDPDSLYSSEEELKKAVSDKKETTGYAIYDLTHFKTYYYDKGLMNDKAAPLTEILRQAAAEQELEKSGIKAEVYQKLQNIPVEVSEEILGRDTTTQYALAFVYVLLFYMVILLYGSVVATAVAREKDSRTMELLITTTDPKELIVGKVLAITCTSALQLVLLVASGLLSFFLFKGMYPPAVLVFIEQMLDLSMAGIYILYFILGLLLYMFIFAALGSVVSRIEDVNTAISPVMFLFVISYFIAISALQTGDSLMVRVSGWIPFFSVMVMPIRYALTSISAGEIIGSTVLTILFIYLFARISIRIYRWGTLNYGNRTNFFKTCKEVFFTK